MRKKRSFKTILLFLFAALTLSMTACKKTDTIAEDSFAVSNIVFSDCLQHHSSGEIKGLHNPDSISIDYHNGTIYVTHYNLIVNCGFENVNVNIDVASDTITILENGSPESADCMCEIDNSFEIKNVPSGSYTVIIKNWDPDPYCQTYNF